MRSRRKVCKKWWDGSLDADDNPDPHQNLIITFGPCTMFLEICMQIRSVWIKSTNWQAKSMRKQLISFAQVIEFS